MNDTAAPGASLLPDSTGLITSMHLVFIALFAIAAVALILIGIRKKRRRNQAEQAFEERVAEAQDDRPEPPARSAVPPASRVAAVQSEHPAASPAPAPARPSMPSAPPAPADLPLARTDPSPAQVDDTPSPEPLADEPIAAADATQASPAAEANAAPPVADTADRPTDPAPADGPLSQLKGLGPKVAGRLADLGITTVGQLAALSDLEAERLDTQLGPFTGRMGRDRWLEQARLLAAGDRAGFEDRFGRL